MSSQRSVEVSEAQAELHEPPDYDPYYSGLASFVFHFCLLMIIPFLAVVVVQRDKLPPAVDVVQVVESTSQGASAFSDLPSGMEAQTPDASADVSLNTTPSEAINRDIQVEAPEKLEFSPEDVRQTADQAVRQARQAAAAAKAAAESVLNDNLGGSAGSAGSGGGTGRAGRAARWVLRFNTRTARDYLSQLGGLGADVAFPAQGGKYRYFTDLAGSPKSSLRDLDSENRIYWMDQDTYFEVARELDVDAEMMIAFLPTPLEEKMAKLEMARARERGVTREEDIIQTLFECVQRGGSFDVIVVDQTLAGS